MVEKAKTPKPRLKPIPRFASEDTERQFWATHDLTDRVDVSQARRVIFPNLKPSTETISARLPGTHRPPGARARGRRP